MVDTPKAVKSTEYDDLRSNGKLPDPPDVVGEWAAKLTYEQLQDKMAYYRDLAPAYNRGERSVNAYVVSKLQDELNKRSETNG